MADFPAMPLWTDAYLADTRHLSTVEHGAYLLLMIEAWRRPSCSLPDDDKLLARLAGLSVDEWADVKPSVMAFWKRDARASTWTQKRLVKEHQYLQEKRSKNRIAAASRWNKTEKEDANGYANAMPKASQPTPTPTPHKKETSSPKKGTRIPSDFTPDLDVAVSLGVPMQMAAIEADKFRDYWTAATGQNATKLDWPATWRNWCRNAAKRYPSRGSPGGGSKTAFRQHQDDVTRNLERMASNGTASSAYDDGQPAFDLEPTAFRSDRSFDAGKR